jgi:hypothetical protein
MAEELSSFQRWKLEDDIKFYATFPQARPDQYAPQYGHYFGFGFNYAEPCCYLTSKPSPSLFNYGTLTDHSLSPQTGSHFSAPSTPADVSTCVHSDQ